MALDFIEEIYKDAYLIPSCKKMAKFCRNEKWVAFKEEWEKHSDSFADLCRRYTLYNEMNSSVLWNSLNKIAEKSRNNSLSEAGDIFEEIIPLLFDAMNMYGKIDVEEGDYRLYSAKSGFLCISFKDSDNIWVSETDPIWEAYEKASAYYNPRMSSFCMIGCDMGYLPWQIYEVAGDAVDIYIYDIDDTVINYAYEYGTLSRIPPERLKISVENDFRRIIQKMLDDHSTNSYGDVTIIEIDKRLRSRMETNCIDSFRLIYEATTSGRNFLNIVERNFYRNYRNVGRYIDRLMQSKNKDWIIVGGGPSLDYNIDYLKSVMKNRILISATTVYGRLLKEGIIPDYLAVIDMQDRTYGHMVDVCNHSVPLIMADSACWMYGELYKGEKYLVPLGELLFADIIYKEKGIASWEVSGTVVAFSIQIAAYFNARTVELIGVDLSYPNNRTHADGTMDQRNVIGDCKVKAVTGEMVNSDSTMVGYKNEIEELIKKNSNIKFYNKSKYGAYIEGAICE